MSTNQSELEAFHRYLGEQLEDGAATMTAEEALRAFRAWQRDVERLREHLAKSEGDDGKSLDTDAVKQRVRERLADHGITD